MKTHRRSHATAHAWAAGIIDGEGCVTIRKTRQLSGGVKKTYYSLIVLVGQSGAATPVMLLRLRDLYGGQITLTKADSRANRQPKWNWCVANRGAEALLKKVSKYLVQKADQAAVALTYREVALGRGKVPLARQYYKKLRMMKHYRGGSDVRNTV